MHKVLRQRHTRSRQSTSAKSLKRRWHTRVLFVNGRADSHQIPGGDTIQVTSTKTALRELGVKVEVRSPHELENLPPYDIAHVFNLQMPESSWAVFQALRRHGRPIVFSPIYWDMLPYWFQSAVTDRARWRWPARLMGKEHVRQIYLNWQRRKAPFTSQWQIQRRLLEQASRILPNSNSEAELLQTVFALENGIREKVDVVPNGIDSALYEKPRDFNGEFLEKYPVRDFVLQVATISPVKNQLGLIQALYDLPVPLVFIGQVSQAMSEYGRKCRIMAEERRNVIFIDHWPHDELPSIYALAAVHVLPSWRETPGLVSLEAAAAGCRVVTTSIGSARDYFGDLAWYCCPDDLRSIRKAVEASLDTSPTPTLRQHVLAEFTWQRAAEATLASYQKALNRP